MASVVHIEEFGNDLALLLDDGTRLLAYRTGHGIWLIRGTVPGGGGGTDIIDTISPGHTVTNPGPESDLILRGWNWHLANNSNRGGVDFDYNFETILAPAAGVVDHFNVSGVGQVIRLILDTPIDRINPAFGHDEPGPIKAIWFQHTSAALDGWHAQGDPIGTSGNGSGLYAPHLHVHGMIDTGTNANDGHRCNLWGFIA